MVDPGELPKLRRFKLDADGKPVAMRTIADADPVAQFYEQEGSPSFADRPMAPNASSDILLSATVDNKKSFVKITPPRKRLDGQQIGTQGAAFPRPSSADIAFRDQLSVEPRVLSDLPPEKTRRSWLISTAIFSLLIIVSAVLAFVRPWQTDSTQVSAGTPPRPLVHRPGGRPTARARRYRHKARLQSGQRNGPMKFAGHFAPTLALRAQT